ncbi:MAG: DUF1998 domain-containing protein, partial [Acholeplasmatales bacterium]|nr:DUF1998 domain-containing protein [Acholeplasmatales bacterium]
YYAKLYKNKKLTPLFIKEHTAQLSKRDALDYQQQFIRKEINALSCSTTFEMGVDLGDLETVFLRNIPPLPSNYAQRVGRAGRSINAAAFAITYARLNSHDFTFFERPFDMITGSIYPPKFKKNNEKILKRHIYAIALSLFLKNNPELYNHNSAVKFINEKGYVSFINWLRSNPEKLSALIKKSISLEDTDLLKKYVDTNMWVEDFVGEKGTLMILISEYEKNLGYLKKEYEKAKKVDNLILQNIFNKKIEMYEKNEFIDFLVRGNILPKYGFPVDSVELSQNISSNSFKTLNLCRDLSVAIAEYAPSSEIIADGWLYTSRYIKKPIVNNSQMKDFETGYFCECPECNSINFTNIPVGSSGILCKSCGNELKKNDFCESIEPRAGFIAEEEVLKVPMQPQEHRYKTDAFYIGDIMSKKIERLEYLCRDTKITIETTSNDSLVVRSTSVFYVCPKCGYSIADDEESKLKKYDDFKEEVLTIKKTNTKHKNPFGKGECENVELNKYYLHHEFKTDVAKLIFDCNTSCNETMLSVMYALLNSFSNTLNIEKRDINACLSPTYRNGYAGNDIIFYDSVPGGAGHSRQIIGDDGKILQLIIKNAVDALINCDCEPSCYHCLRSYENQKFHEILDRKKAKDFLVTLLDEEKQPINNSY